MSAVGRDRSRAAEACGLPRRLRFGAARHARRSLPRCQRQCPRAGIARSRAGYGPGPSARHRACRLGACSACRLSFHVRSPRRSAPEASNSCTRRGRCAATPRCWPSSAMRYRCSTSSIPPTSSFARPLPSTADRHGRGAAADGSTSTRATRDRPSSASRSRSTSRPTIRWRSTAWSGSAVRFSPPVNTPKVRAGRSGRWPNILPLAGCIERCARPMCSRGRDRRPAAASARYGSIIPISPCQEVQRGMPPLPPSQCDLVVGALQEAGLPA